MDDGATVTRLEHTCDISKPWQTTLEHCVFLQVRAPRTAAMYFTHSEGCVVLSVAFSSKAQCYRQGLVHAAYGGR